MLTELEPNRRDFIVRTKCAGDRCAVRQRQDQAIEATSAQQSQALRAKSQRHYQLAFFRHSSLLTFKRRRFAHRSSRRRWQPRKPPVATHWQPRGKSLTSARAGVELPARAF